eukprot:4467044-Prymnesium_polylepis.1
MLRRARVRMGATGRVRNVCVPQRRGAAGRGRMSARSHVAHRWHLKRLSASHRRALDWHERVDRDRLWVLLHGCELVQQTCAHVIEHAGSGGSGRRLRRGLPTAAPSSSAPALHPPYTRLTPSPYQAASHPRRGVRRGHIGKSSNRADAAPAAPAGLAAPADASGVLTDAVGLRFAEAEDPAAADGDAGRAHIADRLQPVLICARRDHVGVVLARRVEVVVVRRQPGLLELASLRRRVDCEGASITKARRLRRR